MSGFDDLLEDAPDSGAFDADLNPTEYDPGDEESALAIEEPKQINIARKKHKDEVQRMSQPKPTERSH